MVSVTARKVRDHSGERTSVGVGRLYTGYLISYPIVGRGMVKITVGKDGKKSYKGLPKELAKLETNVTPAI